MESIWNILGLDPTHDAAAIRQAYARKARDCNPEENQEGFLRLRQAYQAALDYAEGECAAVPEPPQMGNEAEENGWDLPDEAEDFSENPFRDGEAIRKFIELYTGKQRRNPKSWMDYFTSGVFLDVGWDSRFTALMLEEVTRVEQELPPPKEFLLWLTVVYDFSVEDKVDIDWESGQVSNRRLVVTLEPGAEFDGAKSILAIARKAAAAKKLKGNEFAIRCSFRDFCHLNALADSGVWNGQALEEFKWIAGRYSSAYIRERCEQRVAADCERHPAGLRVFTHFFRRTDLPEQLCRIVWAEFDLKNAIMGRSKILYGPLREIVMQRVPGLAEEKQENFFRLNQQRDACFERIRANPEREEQELDALFAQENLQRALRNRRFVEQQLVPWFNWMNSFAPEGLCTPSGRVLPGAPGDFDWERVAVQAELALEAREAERQRQAELRAEAEEAEKFPEELDLSWLLEVLSQVIVQPLTGPERVFYRFSPLEYDEEDEDGDRPLFADGEFPPPGLFEHGGQKKPLTEAGLSAILEQYAQGELERLELFLNGNQMVLVQDQGRGQYGCFCFETGYDTWYAILSQVEEYTVVDSKDVKYYPFGMGMLASYNIHQTTELIMSSLNLALHQLAQGRPQTRVGSVWLWSSHTSQNNSGFKKRMAMQKFAKIPASRAGDYVLSKFVVSKHPFQAETVTLAGERTLETLQPGSYGLASRALVQFFQKKLAKLRLSWEWKTPAGPVRRHMLLLKEEERYMMAWLDDSREEAAFYAIDAPRWFGGKLYPACLVHQELKRIRSCVDLILDDMSCTELVTGRPGEFVLDGRPYAQVRAELLG